MASGLDSVVPPVGWPDEVTYLRESQYSNGLTAEQRASMQCSLHNMKGLLVVKLPCNPALHVSIRRIDDTSHPALGEHGLFATTHLAPDTFIVPYLGHVHSNDASDTNETSDYDLSLDREAGVSVDASEMGTEARFINDYRGVRGQGPNAEFRDVLLQVGNGVCVKSIGVFVLTVGRSGKRKAGIRSGEEVVVSYGKGFWQQRGEVK